MGSVLTDTVPAQIFAGIINGATGMEMRDQVLSCFKPDQKLADDFFEAVS